MEVVDLKQEIKDLRKELKIFKRVNNLRKKYRFEFIKDLYNLTTEDCFFCDFTYDYYFYNTKKIKDNNIKYNDTATVKRGIKKIKEENKNLNILNYDLNILNKHLQEKLRKTESALTQAEEQFKTFKNDCLECNDCVAFTNLFNNEIDRINKQNKKDVLNLLEYFKFNINNDELPDFKIIKFREFEEKLEGEILLKINYNFYFNFKDFLNIMSNRELLKILKKKINQDKNNISSLIYLSNNNLQSGTKLYTFINHQEINDFKFVQNRLIQYDASYFHSAYGNHGTTIDNCRLTINGFIK